MKCPNCGHEVAEGQLYCTACGYKLSKGSPADDLTRTMPSPSTRPNICPYCGSQLTEESDYCPTCGARLFDDENVVSSTADTPSAGGGTSPIASVSATQAMPVLRDNPTSTPQTAQNAPAADTFATQPIPSEPSDNARRTHRPSAQPSPAKVRPRHKEQVARTAIVAVSLVVIAISLGVIGSVVAGVGPFASSDTSTQQQSVTTATTSDDSDDATESDTDTSTTSESTSDAADTSSSSADDDASQQASTTTDSNSDDSDATDDTSSASSDAVTLGSDGTITSTAGYSLTVPTSYHLDSSDASGNAVLTSSDSSCTISISVDPNTSGIDTATAYEQATRGLSSDGYKTTARDMSWYVVSDDTGDTSYYVMSYVEPTRIVTLRFDYPSSSQSTSGPIIESVQPTFKLS